MHEDEENGKSAKTAYQIGQTLDEMSVEELEKTIKLLNQEIERLETIKAGKSAHLSAAEALFQKK